MNIDVCTVPLPIGIDANITRMVFEGLGEQFIIEYKDGLRAVVRASDLHRIGGKPLIRYLIDWYAHRIGVPASPVCTLTPNPRAKADLLLLCN